MTESLALAQAAVSELVERFQRNLEDYQRSAYKEAEVRGEFIDPFFQALGWAVFFAILLALASRISAIPTLAGSPDGQVVYLPFVGRAVCAPATPMAPLTGPYGVVAHLNWTDVYTSQEDIVRACQLMSQAGIQWVKVDFTWQYFEPANDEYQFEQYDRMLTTLTDYGLRVLPVLHVVPRWASSAPEEIKQQHGWGWPVYAYPPSSPDDWADFIGTVVERYDGDTDRDAPGSPRIDYWQVWHEPNMTNSFQPQPDASGFVQMLRTAGDAAHAADPTARIVLGGLGGNGVFMGWEQPEERDFLEAVYDNGGGQYFDVVAIHPSTCPGDGLSWLQAKVDETREVMETHGEEGKPLWITAVGWPTLENAWANPTVSESEVADWLETVCSGLRGVEKIFWYNLRDHRPIPEYEGQTQGLVRWDLAPKPAYNTYTQLVEAHPFRLKIRPSMHDGFEYVCGHPPFTVTFAADVLGSEGALRYTWDLDGNGAWDSIDANPPALVFTDAGIYTATLQVTDGRGRQAQAQRRVVVIGEPEWPAWKYSVCTHLTYIDWHYADISESQRAIDMIADAGIQAVRMDFAWGWMEPAKGLYRWDLYDDLVGRLRQRDLGIIPIPGAPEKWAASIPGDPTFWTTPPRDPRQFAEFMFQLASRYREDIHSWEILNEPNYDYYFRGNDPEVYTAVLRQAYLAVKYADPSAVVVFAGLALGPPAPPMTGLSHVHFLEQSYQAGARPYFDALGYHPYTDPKNPIGPLNQLQNHLNDIRAVMQANGDSGKPIWLTEFGWPSFTAPQGWFWTEQEVGDWLTTAFSVLAQEPDVRVLGWYNFRDKGMDPDDPEHHFGLVRRDFGRKASYYAYQDFVAAHPYP